MRYFLLFALIPLLAASACSDDASSHADAGTDSGTDTDTDTVTDTDSDTGYDNEVLTGIYELDGIDADLPNDDLAPLAEIIGDAELVGLGEPQAAAVTAKNVKPAIWAASRACLR